MFGQRSFVRPTSGPPTPRTVSTPWIAPEAENDVSCPEMPTGTANSQRQRGKASYAAAWMGCPTLHGFPDSMNSTQCWLCDSLWAFCHDNAFSLFKLLRHYDQTSLDILLQMEIVDLRLRFCSLTPTHIRQIAQSNRPSWLLEVMQILGRPSPIL